MSNIYKKLLEVQSTLKAPKGQTNSFGNYKYRSAEDILTAVKPLLKEHGLAMTLSDEVLEIGTLNETSKDGTVTESTKNYVKSTVTLFDVDEDATISVSALAREANDKKGMDDAQITGAASSYARKYALNGMFDIDDTKDPDTDEHTVQHMDPKDKELSRAKVWLHNQLIKQGYESDTAQKAFIKLTLGKESIRTKVECDEVLDALKNEEVTEPAFIPA